MQFTTETGSVYEVDETGKKMRRVSGEHPPTANQGDGGWQSYVDISEVMVGKQVLIVWGLRGDTLEDLKVARTQTSRVVEVLP